MITGIDVILVLSAMAMGAAVVFGLSHHRLSVRLALALLILAAALGAVSRKDWSLGAPVAVNLLKLLLVPLSGWAVAQGLREFQRLYLPLALGIVLLFGASGTTNLARGPLWQTRFWFADAAPGPDFAIAAATAGALLWHFWTSARRSPQPRP